jgi:hypothetical protein
MGDILKDRVIGEKDAVMFDIDDTLIFTNGKANVPIINLLKYAMNLGYKIVIITARPNTIFTDDVYEMAIEQIWYTLPYSHHNTSIQNKGNVKVKTGLNYVLSVGDQPTDLTHTKHALKISI